MTSNRTISLLGEALELRSLLCALYLWQAPVKGFWSGDRHADLEVALETGSSAFPSLKSLVKPEDIVIVVFSPDRWGELLSQEPSLQAISKKYCWGFGASWEKPFKGVVSGGFCLEEGPRLRKLWMAPSSKMLEDLLIPLGGDQ